VQRDIQAEVILCPNCNEDVPKTLYCLNCGYPLYKVEQEQSELEETEVMEDAAVPEAIEWTPISEAETDAEASSMIVDVQVPVEQISVNEENEELQLASADEAIETELTEVEEAEGEIEAELEAQIQEDVEEEDETFEEEVPEVTEAEVEELEEEIEETVEEVTVDEELSEEIQEIPTDFESDPLTTMVMENLAKNISVKVKLISLLGEGNVKETTFNRLFESYAARGDRWTNKRSEMLERSRYNLDTMEKTLAEARINQEELEIRKAIGDASEEEYQAKTPAFNWDINVLKEELRQRKGEIAYLEDLTRVMPVEEMEELRETAESCHSSLDNLVEEGKISPETVTRIKASLEEIINSIDSPNND